jgi:carbon monoxide dehydrogenase subunit G
MAITVPIELGYEFDVNAMASEVFDVLADVPVSASFYPKVDKLTALGDGAYRWEMAKIGIGQASIQTVYASCYVANKTKGTIAWTPVAGESNAKVSGNWKITDNKNSTNVVLSITAELTVPLPALMKVVVTPLIESEFEKLTEQYIDNLIQRFGGEI